MWSRTLVRYGLSSPHSCQWLRVSRLSCINRAWKGDHFDARSCIGRGRVAFARPMRGVWKHTYNSPPYPLFSPMLRMAAGPLEQFGSDEAAACQRHQLAYSYIFIYVQHRRAHSLGLADPLVLCYDIYLDLFHWILVVHWSQIHPRFTSLIEKRSSE